MSITWHEAHKENLKEIKAFVLQHEVDVVSIAEEIKNVEENYEYETHFLAIALREQKIIAIFFINRSATLFPYWEGHESTAIIKSLGAQNAIHTKLLAVRAVMGRRDTVQILSRFIHIIKKRRAHHTTTVVEYLLMTLDKLHFNRMEISRSSSLETKIARATSKDIDYILPLHIEYLKEEVQLSEHQPPMSAHYARDHLRNSLTHHTYYVVWHNARVIAKANTNVEGYRCAQLGGIFTQKQYRNLGIGYNCVTSLCELLFTRYTTLVLFVKRHNTSAISLYRSIGFARRCDYAIHYF